MGFPACVVADAGHRNGARIRDFGAFGDPDSPRTAVLIECGQHWARRSVRVANAACRQFLAALEVVEPRQLDRLGRPPARKPQRVVEVTEAVTVAAGRFRFTQEFQGLEVIPEAGTVIAYDGALPVRTPYDQCVLIMPSRRLAPGFTAVRLGRFVAVIDWPCARGGPGRTLPTIVACRASVEPAKKAKPAPAPDRHRTCASEGLRRQRPLSRAARRARRPRRSATRCSIAQLRHRARRARAYTVRTSTSCPRRAARASGRALMAAVARACQADGGRYLFWNALEATARHAPSTGASARARRPRSRSACSRTRWMSWRRRPRRRSEVPRLHDHPGAVAVTRWITAGRRTPSAVR